MSACNYRMVENRKYNGSAINSGRCDFTVRMPRPFIPVPGCFSPQQLRKSALNRAAGFLRRGTVKASTWQGRIQLVPWPSRTAAGLVMVCAPCTPLPHHLHRQRPSLSWNGRSTTTMLASGSLKGELGCTPRTSTSWWNTFQAYSSLWRGISWSRMPTLQVNEYEAGLGELVWAQRSPPILSLVSHRSSSAATPMSLAHQVSADATQHPLHGRNLPRPRSSSGAMCGHLPCLSSTEIMSPR